MAEHINNGLQLGWLIDPANKTVYVYTPDADDPKILSDIDSVAGDPVLPGFVLDLSKIWQDGSPCPFVWFDTNERTHKVRSTFVDARLISDKNSIGGCAGGLKN